MKDYTFRIIFLMVFVFNKLIGGEWIKEMEDPNFFEGDIVLSPEERNELYNGTFMYASATRDMYWPRGIPIAYEIAKSIYGNGLQAIKDAIADYQKYTCIRFKERKNERQYLYFYRGAGCSSPVGRKYRNDISLARNCWKKGIVMHEMAHSLGMFHEQSRPDRDSHIKILWENIQGDEKVNFQKEPANTINSWGTPYDLKSMMHYPSNAFGGGKMTIKVLDSSKQSWIGQREGFSETDKKQLNLMYGCGSTVPRTTAQPTAAICVDKERHCKYWASQGYCADAKERDYMKKNCCKSCAALCTNKHVNCETWAQQGVCKRGADYMSRNCRKACNMC